jgi:hypothetical protein
MPSHRRSILRALARAFAHAPLFLAVACGGTTSGDTPGDAGSDAAGCTKGETKKLDCNSCTCQGDGLWACTTIACMDAASFDTAAPDTAIADTAKADVAVDAPANDPRCPKDWISAQGTHDDLCPAHLTCNYAEGSCTCPAYCGGPPPGPDWKPTWTCTPTPPPRTDGCPDAEPADGSACTGLAEHKVCDYGTCCFDQLECLAGKWKKSGPICPP